MATSDLLVYLVLLSLTSAIPWEGPLITNTASAQIHLADYSPVPTQVPKPLVARDVTSSVPTALPGSSQGCGWLWGINQPWVPCSPFSTCVWRADIRAVGCCRDTTNLNTCSMYTTCINFSDLGASSSTESDSLQLRCTNSETPWCASLRYEPSYYNFKCAESATFWDIHTTYINAGEIVFATDIPRYVLPISANTTASFTGAPFSISTTPTPLSSSSASIAPVTSSTSVSPATSSTPATSHRKTIIGASVGGGLGAVIICLIGALIYFYRKPKPDSINQGGLPLEEIKFMHIPSQNV